MPNMSQKDYEIAAEFSLALQMVKEALQRIPATLERVDEQNGTVLARKGFNLKSYGEVLRVWIYPIAEGSCHITIQSELAVGFQVVDWGVNDDNINNFESGLSLLLLQRNLPVLKVLYPTDSSQRSYIMQDPNPQPPTYSGQPPSPQQPSDFFRRPPKDKSIALILEILPGLFGIYGIGWIYGNNTNTGLLLLIGGLIWLVIAILINVFTGGFGCFCTIPINIAIVALSSIQLNTYTKQHPELFS